MTSSKSTKRALISSVLAMLLCAAMLIGATFAWFTDTASTAVNKIQAGNLDVDIVDMQGNSLDGKTLTWQKPNDAANEDVLWEPGCTYYLTPFHIQNKGNLALKFKVLINGVSGDNKLLEALEFGFYYFQPGFGDMRPLEELAAGDKLDNVADYPGVWTAPIYIVAHMKEDAGNEYQGLSIDGIGITVVATQYTYESDSFDNTYDKDAGYPVASAAEMKEALANGGIVSVNKDIKTDNIGDNEADRITISKPTTLNLDAKIISPDDMGNNNTNFCALIVDADTTINAGKNGGIDTGANGGYALNVRKGANLTITGGSYYGGGTAVQVQEGTLTITGGHFAVEAFGEPYGYNFLLNCIDSAYKNGTAKIIVMGGTFVNFNPADCQAEGEHTNFVADGYKVVSENQTNGEVWYTVVPQ